MNEMKTIIALLCASSIWHRATTDWAAFRALFKKLSSSLFSCHCIFFLHLGALEHSTNQLNFSLEEAFLANLESKMKKTSLKPDPTVVGPPTLLK